MALSFFQLFMGSDVLDAEVWFYKLVLASFCFSIDVKFALFFLNVADYFLCLEHL